MARGEWTSEGGLKGLCPSRCRRKPVPLSFRARMMVRVSERAFSKNVNLGGIAGCAALVPCVWDGVVFLYPSSETRPSAAAPPSPPRIKSRLKSQMEETTMKKTNIIRKAIAGVLAAVMCLALAACGSEAAAPQPIHQRTLRQRRLTPLVCATMLTTLPSTRSLTISRPALPR